jgi:hypothetical protein
MVVSGSRSSWPLTLWQRAEASKTLVVAFYPLGGNDVNTGPRFHREAELAGVDMLAVTRAGTNGLVPSRRLRQRLSPAVFETSLDPLFAQLEPVCRRYARVLLRGQSTGAFPALAVAAARRLPVTDLLIEDGLNARPSTSADLAELLSGNLHWLKHSMVERRRMQPPEGAEPLRRTGSGTRLPAVAFLVEQYHWEPLWRSDYGRETLLAVIREQPRLPVSVVLFGHSGTASPIQAEELRVRLNAAGAERLVLDEAAAPVAVRLEPDSWHGWLLYPEVGASNILWAIGRR